MIITTEDFSDSFFSKFKILPGVKSSVVIPVKDEESYILKTLDSFANQKNLSGKPIDFKEFEILVLANNCSDQSVSIIKKFQIENPHINIYLEEVTLLPNQANIGFVRRKLMDCACARLIKNGGGIILTTDGDTMVAPDWIAQTQLEINSGAEVVGGRILLYPNELESLDEFTLSHHLKDEKYQLLIAELEGHIINYNFDPVPRHHQHFNGSFAITTGCYVKSGGVPVVDHLEDCAFFDRLRMIDAKIRHSHQVTVHTSARWVGRTEIGLSYQLNIWKNLGTKVENCYVECADSIVHRLTEKRSLKDIWDLKGHITKVEFKQLIQQTIPEFFINDEIFDLFNNSIYFGEWYEKVSAFSQKRSENKFPDVPVDIAIRDLQIRLKEYSNHDFVQTSIR